MDHPSFLRWLDPSAKAAFMHESRTRTMPARTVVFVQGDPMSELLIVRRGRIRVFYHSPSGHSVTFSYWNAGALVGTPSILEQFEHRWSAETAAETEVLAIPRNAMLDLMREHSCVMLAVIEALEFKAKLLGGMLQARATGSAHERLLQTLLHLASVYGRPHMKGVLIDVAFSHDEIANLVGASRQWVTTMLGEFERAGVVGRIGRRIVVSEQTRSVGGDQSSG